MSCHLSDSQRQKKLCSLLILHMAFKGLCQGSSTTSLLKKRGRIYAWRRQTPWVRCSRGLWSWTLPLAQASLLVSALAPGGSLEALSRLWCSFSCCLRFRGFSPAAFYSPSVGPISQPASLFSFIFFCPFPPLGLYPQKVLSA